MLIGILKTHAESNKDQEEKTRQAETAGWPRSGAIGQTAQGGNRRFRWRREAGWDYPIKGGDQASNASA
jgi:hypothetical protein